ncbi:MAG: hypothetical protein JXB47_18010 [Anaerolineae bacterium]|nr:hypothetical protein [Anaerolineae bacterium]
MDIVLDGKRIRLDNQAVLGTGGEATVIRHDRWAVKIYHVPGPERAAKLKDLVALPRRLPDAVVAPEVLAYDTDRSRPQVIGFAMRMLDPGYVEVAQLAHKRFRAANGITTPGVAALFADGHGTLAALHLAGFVIGDLNDLNVLFRGGKMAFIDVDSYQFKQHPCRVATESFVDPALYGVDLSKGAAFRPENDWYSYAVLLFKSLLLVHPYGGVHLTVKTLTARAQQRMTVFVPGVKYPKIALHPDTLNDDLLQVFERYFAQGWRGEFPLGVLQAYAGELVECGSCGAFYPRARPHCPVCTTITPVAEPERRIVTDGCTVETLIGTRGQIVFSKALDDGVYAVAHEDGKAVLYAAVPGRPQRRRRLTLFNQIPAARYEIIEGYLIVAPDPAQETLMVIDIGGDRPQGALQTTTRLFGGSAPVFGAARGALYRLAGGYLMRGEIRGGELVERALTSVMENQTWLRVAPRDDLALGYFRTFRTRQYFLIDGARRYEIAPAPLADAESLTGSAALFGRHGALLVRHTRLAGVDYVRLDEVSRAGAVVFSQRRKRAESRLYELLGGQAYEAGIVLHATDDGIVQERLADGGLRTFAATEPYVAEGDRLIPYQNGILVVKSDRVLFLTLG